MKKLILLLLSFLPGFLFGNPIWLGVNISEIYFNEKGEWTLEIDNWSSGSMAAYLDSIIIETNSGKAKIVDFNPSNFIVVTNLNLNIPLSIDKDADCIKLYSYRHQYYKTDSLLIGNIEGSYIKNVKNGQSITRLYLTGYFYKDNSPTIGQPNDLDGSTGKIYGHFYDSNNQPIGNRYFFINEGHSGNTIIDKNGAYTAEITTRSYSISKQLIYQEYNVNEWMEFEPVNFDLEEHDSLLINFTRVLSNAPSFKQKKVLLMSYPNPTVSSLYFITEIENKPESPYIITVCGLDGRLIDSVILTSEQQQWDCSHLKPGTYIYSLKVRDKTVASNKFQIVR